MCADGCIRPHHRRLLALPIKHYFSNRTALFVYRAQMSASSKICIIAAAASLCLMLEATQFVHGYAFWSVQLSNDRHENLSSARYTDATPKGQPSNIVGPFLMEESHYLTVYYVVSVCAVFARRRCAPKMRRRSAARAPFNNNRSIWMCVIKYNEFLTNSCNL